MSIFKKIGQNNEKEQVLTDKKGIFLYFELLLRKFWNYIKLNLLYVLTSLLTFAFYFVICAGFVVPVILGTIPEENFKIMADAAGGMDLELFYGSLIWALSCIMSLIIITFFGGGVCSAGYHYILRNYARQENAYVFSDYFQHTKLNFKQSFLLSLIDKLLVSMLLISASYYYAMMFESNSGFVPVIAFALMIFALYLFGAMHIYMWTMMVTFKVTLKQLFKNSFLLTIGTAVRTVFYILSMLIFTVLAVILFANSQIFVIVFYIILLFVLVDLAGHLVSYPVIKKYMIDNNNKNEEGTEN